MPTLTQVQIYISQEHTLNRAAEDQKSSISSIWDRHQKDSLPLVMPVDNLWINCEVSANLCTRNKLLNGFIYCGPMPIVEPCWAYARAQRLCARTNPFRSGQLCPVPPVRESSRDATTSPPRTFCRGCYARTVPRGTVGTAGNSDVCHGRTPLG